MKKQLIKEVQQFKKIAGLLKEYIESDPETITQAFQQAGIDLNRPVFYIVDAGRGPADKPVKMLGGQLLKKLEAERAKGEAANPEYNEEEGVTYDFEPGEVDPDLQPVEVRDIAPKLYVQFSDLLLYEIYQAEEMKETWHPDDPAGVDLDDREEDLDDYDDISEDDYSEDPSSDTDDESQSGDTGAMNINEEGESIIIDIPENTDYKELARAVAKVLINDYGVHNYKPFLQALISELK